MLKNELENFINKGFSIRKISKQTNNSYSTIRYWILKYKLSTKRTLSNKNEKEKYCPRCKETKNRSEFYQRRGKIGSSTYCKSCTSEQTLERMRLLKQKCVEYKGGKCIKCGYDKYYGSLHFHHLDPIKKDFCISGVRSYTFNDKIKKELDKCVLVCSNCHGEIHGNI